MFSLLLPKTSTSDFTCSLLSHLLLTHLQKTDLVFGHEKEVHHHSILESPTVCQNPSYVFISPAMGHGNVKQS